MCWPHCFEELNSTTQKETTVQCQAMEIMREEIVPIDNAHEINMGVSKK